MFETSKSNFLRRTHERKFVDTFFKGEGIDIGAGANPTNYMFLYSYVNDKLKKYIERGLTNNKDFPNIQSCEIYSEDWNSKNIAEELCTNVTKLYDFVYSSNLLEHVIIFERALLDFSIITKDNGYVISVVPDFELYENSVWPPTKNHDHKHCFSLNKKLPINRHISITNSLKNFFNLELVYAQIVDTNYDYDVEFYDQTDGYDTEAFIEFVCKKKKGSYKNYDTLTVKEFDIEKDYNLDVLVIPDRDLTINEQKRIDNLPRTDTYLPLADNYHESPKTYPTLYNVDYLRSLNK